MISTDEALSIFNKWKEESSLVEFLGGAFDKIPMLRPPGTFSKVIEISEFPLSVKLQGVSGKNSALSIDLEGASFEYADARVLSSPKLVSKRWVCFIQASWPNGRVFVFGERSDEE